VCLTQYDATIKAPVAFEKLAKMKNIMAQYLAELGITQFRCAETEKYAHVTFFFNDYTEAPFPGEERQIVPSPKVRTYDLQPEMSAREVANVVLEKLNENKFDVIIVNFANPDMVGHTGVTEAAITAAQVVDECVGKILNKIKELGGAAIITADHGNFEQMYDTTTSGPHTAHTVGDVPLIVFDDENKHCSMKSGGRLADVIPTLFDIMEIPKPQEMTGESLLV
jgi:2,3-bisphosphoglycerate-independent phosphoglycerate mutase